MGGWVGEMRLGHFPSALQSFSWSAPKEPRGATASSARGCSLGRSESCPGASASRVHNREGSVIAILL